MKTLQVPHHLATIAVTIESFTAGKPTNTLFDPTTGNYMSRGDHIYVNRLGGLYNHHGIDCGDETVIHYTSDHWMTPRQLLRTEIKKFARGDELLVRDYEKFYETLTHDDATLNVLEQASTQFNQMLDAIRGIKVKELDFSADAVIQRAESRLGEFNFDIVFNNCEHFASWCKTGISGSNQINAIWRNSLSSSQFLKYRTGNFLTSAFENPWKLRW